MRQTIFCICLIFCLFAFVPQSGFSAAAPQSLADLLKSGSVHLARDIVISEKEFPEGVYFQNPRGIVVHSDGRIYISDSLAHNIKMISSSGQIIKVFGQEGQGPGDLNSPTFIAISRDRLVVWESMNRRFSLFNMNGAFINSVKVEDDMGWILKMRTLPDGRFVVLSEVQLEGDNKFSQLYSLVLMSVDLKILKILYTQKLRKRKLITEPMRVFVPQPFTPSIHWDVTSEGNIVVGCSDLCDIEIHDPDNGRLSTFFHEYTPVKVTAADKDNHFSIFTMNIISGNKMETKKGAPDYIKENTDFPKYKPAFKEIVTDDEGNIWVKSFQEDRGLEDQLFDVFDKKGQFITRVRVLGDTTFPSLYTSKISHKEFWEIENVDGEFFRIVRNKIGE